MPPDKENRWGERTGAARAVGNGKKVCIVQFVKGVWNTGEREVLKHFPDLCVMKAMGEGFTWDTQDRARDIAAARPPVPASPRAPRSRNTPRDRRAPRHRKAGPCRRTLRRP